MKTLYQVSFNLRKSSFSDISVFFKVLQERFDDQSVTLRVTKESIGDIQERMVASETTFAVSSHAKSHYPN